MSKMAKPCGTLAERFACTASISDDVPEQRVKDTLHFLKGVGISDPVPDHCETKDFYSYLVRGILKPLNIQRGRVTCLVSVKPAFINSFGGFHGGAIAAVAEAVSVATARTVVAEDKELFLGELSISYLSSAPKNAEVIVDGSVVRSGRNLTVIAQEFKLKKTGNLIYTARATFYHMPVSKL
ncbi:putative HotDog domain-containing protein [Rosa chinensis]|uniref:Putative HotDog domain-containing protein n=1 Tax=Rosa chinensis TaxID=74649 RepID=A0A2P6SGN8_ROSCH|nr:uncharacterized protein LOC112182351 [Rosa chinensis]PRQ57850.1 putative HotDog domain-containing protein [Rosa chinensis]